MIRSLTIAGLAALATTAIAGNEFASGPLIATLTFEQTTSTNGNCINAFLEIDNTNSYPLSWVCDPKTDIRASVQQPDGELLTPEPMLASILSSRMPFIVPPGSRLEWLITASRAGEMSACTLMIGSTSWRLPQTEMTNYTIEVEVTGVPVNLRDIGRPGTNRTFLFKADRKAIQITRPNHGLVRTGDPQPARQPAQP